MYITIGFEVVHYLHRLFHLAFIVEVHLDMDTLASNVIEQGAQLVECHPTSHDALTTSQNLAV